MTTYEQVLEQADIESVISAYGINIQRGKALCPFHDDKSPSMSVSKTKKIYKCFSCGESGNAISFVKNYENKVNLNKDFTVTDALRKVAEICNINIKIYGAQKNSVPMDPAIQNIVTTNKEVQKVFSYMLYTERGKVAAEYLNKRNIGSNLIQELQIGYAPERDILSLENQNLGNYIAAGLVTDNASRNVFRDRIIFPLCDPEGNIIGFSGRILSKDKSNIKYLNTAETPAFVKGNNLYNYHRAKSHAYSKELVVVEGFMDVVSLEKIGVKNSVALMGTALTKNQIALIKKLNCRVNLMLDNDAPGKNAMLLNVTLLKEAGVDVIVTDLQKITSVKDIGELVEATEVENYKGIVQKLPLARIQPLEFKVEQYLESLELLSLDSIAIEDAYKFFKKEIESTKDRLLFLDCVSRHSSYSKEEIIYIVEPVNLTNYEAFKNMLMYSTILENLKKEVTSDRKDMVLQRYIDLNEKEVVVGINEILKINPELLGKGDLNISTALNSYLGDNKKYKDFADLNNFKFPSVLDNIHMTNKEGQVINANLSKSQKNLIIRQFDQLNDKVKDELKQVSQIFVITNPEDLYTFLPTSLLNRLQFQQIQNNYINGKMSVLDFNTLFDVNLIENGMLDFFDQSYKNEEGKLKTVLLYSNSNKELEYKQQKSVVEDLKKEALEKEGKKQEVNKQPTVDKATKVSYINVRSILLKKEVPNGYYFSAPNNPDKIFYTRKNIVTVNSQKTSLAIDITNGGISEYKYMPQTKDFTFVKQATVEDIEKHFKVFSKDVNDKSKYLHFVFNKQDVDIVKDGDKEKAKIYFQHKNQLAYFQLSKSYISKEVGDSYFLKLKNDWKYAAKYENGQTFTISAQELKDTIVQDKKNVNKEEFELERSDLE